jgi:hypothetical protein
MKHLALGLFLSACLVPYLFSQAPSTLNNEMVIRMVQSGVPSDVIIRTIVGAPSVAFSFLPADLQAFAQYKVPEDVFKAMAAKDAGRSIPVSTPAAQPPTRSTPPSSDQIPQSVASSGPPQSPRDSDKIRVYITDSNSWAASGGFATSRGSGGGSFSAGSKPQTVELIKTFGERCPSVVVTMEKTKADFVVLFDRESAKGIARKRDKIAVFKKDGDVLYSESVRSVGTAVQDSCASIEKEHR